MISQKSRDPWWNGSRFSFCGGYLVSLEGFGMSTKAAFKKGDLVTHFCDYDRKGTVSYRQCIVHSCGKKQMVLTDLKTGKEMGRHFRPEIGGFHFDDYLVYSGTMPVMSEEDSVAFALSIASQIVAAEKSRLERALARSGDNHYFKQNMLREIDLLHEPRVIEYPDILI